MHSEVLYNMTHYRYQSMHHFFVNYLFEKLTLDGDRLLLLIRLDDLHRARRPHGRGRELLPVDRRRRKLNHPGNDQRKSIAAR